MSNFIPGLLVLIGLALGCAPAGPNYQRVDPPVPAQFGSLQKGISTGELLDDGLLVSWWKIFQDPVLNSLVERAVRGNLDLRMAEARVRQARALTLVSESKNFPEGQASGGYQRQRRTESGFSGQTGGASGGLAVPFAGAGQRETDLFFAGFDASWEIDVFGGIRREIEASQADLAASEEALRNALVTLQGEVARNYIELRGQQLRLGIALREVEIRKENLELIDARLRAGLVNELDLARGKAELAIAESRIPLLENSLRGSFHRLGVLLGQEPLSLAAELEMEKQLPEVPENIPAGLPSDLLLRRPDIRRAERELAASTARIGVSTAELFPKFSLTGSFGYQGTKLEELPRESSNYWRIGPSFRWSILNFKRITANVEFNKAAREEALSRYEKTILNSLEEVENALVALAREKRRTESLEEAVKANALAFELALERYQAGVQSYLEVLDAETALYNGQDQLAQSRQNRVLALIALYKALGGGWTE
ncbi:MAG: transcriptional regulator, Fis family [Deltaproteobacteria bacterium]|jgi:NodT family efflux transporter outer membrane factor (OMF) lipoprotein|nr:transcriptional regulator, Fis family [Deltaproteobacteria bacterium]